MTFNQMLAGIGIVTLAIWLAWHDIRTQITLMKSAIVALAEANKVAAEAWTAIAKTLEEEQ